MGRSCCPGTPPRIAPSHYAAMPAANSGKHPFIKCTHFIIVILYCRVGNTDVGKHDTIVLMATNRTEGASTTTATSTT